MNYMKKFSFLFVFIWVASTSYGLALSLEQAQEIRHAKALVMLSQSQNNQALKLLRRNMDGPFHRETFITLARYFFEKKQFTKSFRLYQVLIKRGIGTRVANLNYNHKLKGNFQVVLSKTKKPKLEDLAVVYELAQRYYATYNDRTLPQEFSRSILSLSEKYFSICKHFNFFSGEASLSLARINLINEEFNFALDNLIEAQKLYQSPNRDNHFKEGTLLEDIRVLLAETYIKRGQGDVGLLLIRSLSAQSDLDPAIRTYTKNYLKELNSSFVNVIFNYGIKQKQNINQLSELDYENFENLPNRQGAAKKDALIRAGRLNVFMNRQISDQYNVSGSLDITNESALSKEVDTPNFTNTALELSLKRYKDDNSIFLLDYKFNNLSGRELQSLQFIQPKVTHQLSAGYQWLLKKGLLTLEAPVEFSSFLNERSTNLISIAARYEPLITGRWLAPEYYTTLGRRSEGELFSSSLLFQMGLNNKTQLSADWYLFSYADLYFNHNADKVLSYSELNLGLRATRSLSALKGLGLELGYLMTKRSFSEDVGSFNMNEFTASLTYNF